MIWPGIKQRRAFVPRCSMRERQPPNRQMQSDRPIGARLRVGGAIAGCEKEAIICVGAGFIGPAADLRFR